MMIDWVSVLVPLPHSKPINGGNVVSVSPDGDIEWSVEKRMNVEGSFGSSMQIRSEHKDYFCSHIRLDGNPVKFMQGHNVWGSSDLHGLVTGSLIKLIELVSPSTSLACIHHLCKMGRLTRVDLNCMYDLGTSHNVNSWLRAASEASTICHRGRGQFSGDTLYWGKKSRRWSLKAYWKGGELRKHKPKSFTDGGYPPTELQSVQDYADRALRVEVVLRGMELSKFGLLEVQSWKETSFEEVYNRYVGKLEFSENMKVGADIPDLDKLPARLRAPVQLWYEGHDLRKNYSRATWYRYKREILNRIGLDISLPQPKQRPDCSNVVPLVRVLEAVPMGVPDWAKGTDLYYEPPHYPDFKSVS